MKFFADGNAKANIKFETKCIIVKGNAKANATNIDVIDVCIIKGVNEFMIISKAKVPISVIAIISR